jgi:hypothetical protein
VLMASYSLTLIHIDKCIKTYEIIHFLPDKHV